MTRHRGVEVGVVGEPDPSLSIVAEYRRVVGASLERVWENVLDWGHLPWFHSSTIAEIECESSGDWGWRARVGHPGGAASYPIELRVDRSRSRYVTRVPGESSVASEIWTRLSVRAERITGIEVEFRLAVESGSDPDSLGQGYIALYTRLWDEDEAMMQQRQNELDRCAGPVRGPVELVLGTREEVLSRAPYSVELAGRVFRVAGSMASSSFTPLAALISWDRWSMIRRTRAGSSVPGMATRSTCAAAGAAMVGGCTCLDHRS